MQPIERIGVFALLALAVMVVAVWLFDSQPDASTTQVAAKERTNATEVPSAKPTVHVPQLGQTTSKNRSKPSASKPSGSNQLSPSQGAKSDWKQRKAEHDALKREQMKASDSQPGLPVSSKVQSLTPAPKRTTSTNNAARHVPANKPATRISDQAVASRLKPQTPNNGAQSTKSSQSKPTSEKAQSATPIGNYTVAKGDTLSEISLSQLGTSTRWREIEKLNGVRASSLKVGMELRMPARLAKDGGGSASRSVQTKPAKTTAKAGGTNYEVSSGDSLWLIAQRQLGDGNRWAEIASLNSDINPNKLVVGTALAMPTGAATVAPKRPTQVASARTAAPSKKPRVR
ncbi:MAG: nucleoid-associated protein YgaU [Planctomycetota bacterium]|jgi:nucleoid-associated protein YgaU